MEYLQKPEGTDENSASAFFFFFPICPYFTQALAKWDRVMLELSTCSVKEHEFNFSCIVWKQSYKCIYFWDSGCPLGQEINSELSFPLKDDLTLAKHWRGCGEDSFLILLKREALTNLLLYFLLRDGLFPEITMACFVCMCVSVCVCAGTILSGGTCQGRCRCPALILTWGQTRFCKGERPQPALGE